MTQYCVLSIGYQHIALPIKQATAVFEQLAGAVALESVYNGATSHKIVKQEPVKLSHLPPGEFEKIMALYEAETTLKE